MKKTEPIKNNKYKIDEISEAIKRKFPKNMNLNNTYFICIGTDRSTGDALGPLVGTYLTELGYKNVIGTLDDPVHAMNIKEKIILLPKDKYIIAIDACLGKVSSVGLTQIGRGPCKPGAGVNVELPPVGDYHIIPIVNIGGFMEYFVLQNTRLSLVTKLARAIANGLNEKLAHASLVATTTNKERRRIINDRIR